MSMIKILKIVIFDILLVMADAGTDLYNALVWLPGVLFTIWILFRVYILRVTSIKTGALALLVGGLLNPFFIPIIYGYAICLNKTNRKEKSDEIFIYSIFFKCLEGMSESAPQLMLNTYFFATRGFYQDNGDFEWIPMIAAIVSILSITKSSTENHFIEVTQHNPSFTKMLIAAPVFLFHVLFRTLMYGIIIAFLREYILVLWSVTIVLSWVLAKIINKTHIICTSWTSIGSLFSTIAFKHIEKGVVTGPGYLYLPQILAFYFANTLVTFTSGVVAVVYIVVNIKNGEMEIDPIPEISCYPSGSNITGLQIGRICDENETPNYYLEYVVLPLVVIYGTLTVLFSFSLWVYSRMYGKTVEPIICQPGNQNWTRSKAFISTYPKFLSIGNGWKSHWREPEIENPCGL